MKMKWMKTAVALVLCLVMVSVSVVAAAVADETIKVPDGNVYTKEVDNVDVSIPGFEGAVNIEDSDTQDTSLTVSDNVINTVDDFVDDLVVAAYISAKMGHEALLSVVNNVIANSKTASYGLKMNAREKKSTAKAIIGGNVSATGAGEAYAVSSMVYTDGNADIYVGGDVKAEAENASAEAIRLTNYSATTNTEVCGDVTAQGNEKSIALAIQNLSYYPDEVSKVDVFVGGNVSSTGNGLEIYSYNNSTESSDTIQTKVELLGNLTADNQAIVIKSADNTDVIVDGTVSGTNGAVLLTKTVTDTSTLNIAVWKMEPDENGTLVQWEDGDAEDVEKNIWYIIHVEQPEDGATLTATGTGQIVGRDTVYEVAHEGDTVYLDAVVMPGWQILNAFWDEYQTQPMDVLDENTFYMVMPFGGGVILTAVLEHVEPEVSYAKPECERPNYTVSYRDPADRVSNYSEFITVDPNAKSSKFTVSMIGNGGKIDGRNAIIQKVQGGESLTLPIPVQDGKTFLGWSTGDNTELIPGGTSVVITEKVAYRAMWN